MHLHNCRCFQKYLKMLFQSLRAQCLAPGGPGSIRKYLRALEQSTRGFQRFLCSIRTDLHFADAGMIVLPLDFVQCVMEFATQHPSKGYHIMPIGEGN